jgi:hypothetical protein
MRKFFIMLAVCATIGVLTECANGIAIFAIWAIGIAFVDACDTVFSA